MLHVVCCTLGHLVSGWHVTLCSEGKTCFLLMCGCDHPHFDSVVDLFLGFVESVLHLPASHRAFVLLMMPN